MARVHGAESSGGGGIVLPLADDPPAGAGARAMEKGAAGGADGPRTQG